MNARRWTPIAALFLSAMTPMVGPASAAPIAAAADPCDLADPRLDLDGRPIDGNGDPSPTPCPDPSGATGGGGPAAVALTVQTGRWTVRVGETVTVPVSLLNPQRTPVANLNVEVGYRAAVVSVDPMVLPGSLFAGALKQTNAGQPERVLVGIAQRASAGGELGTGSLSAITFRAVGQPGDRTPLTVNVTTINAPDGAVLSPVTVNGEIEIVGPDGGRVGDCDGDGQLRENDALCALQISVQLLDAPPALRTALDLDVDRAVTSRDAAIILQRALGIA